MQRTKSDPSDIERSIGTGVCAKCTLLLRDFFVDAELPLERCTVLGSDVCAAVAGLSRAFDSCATAAECSEASAAALLIVQGQSAGLLVASLSAESAGGSDGAVVANCQGTPGVLPPSRLRMMRLCAGSGVADSGCT